MKSFMNPHTPVNAESGASLEVMALENSFSVRSPLVIYVGIQGVNRSEDQIEQRCCGGHS